MSSKNVYLAIEGSAKNWEEAIRLCGKHLMDRGSVGQDFIDGCIEREKEYPTGLPSDIPVAIPHSQSNGIKENCVCFLRLDQPVRFNRMDDDEAFVETKLIFNLAIKAAEDHLTFLQKLMEFVTTEGTLKQCSELPLEEIPAFIERELG